jgi:glyoxylate reductase
MFVPLYTLHSNTYNKNVKVLLTRELPLAGLNILHQYSELELVFNSGAPMKEEKFLQEITNADAFIPVSSDKITKDVLKKCKNLKLIATYSDGHDHIDIEEATKKGIYVGNTPGDLTESVAEFAFTAMLSLAKRLPEADRYCRDKKYKFWNPSAFMGPKMTGKKLGVIGFGRIGQQFARMAKYGLGMEIMYNSPTPKKEAEMLLDAKRVSLDELLGESDVVSIHCPLKPETKHLIDDNALRKMKPLALLINTARGPIVNEQALATALKEGVIAGAALDVFENEPKVTPALLSMENVILSPHIASATWEARIEMARMTAENVVDVLINNKPPRYLVNTELTQKESISSLA